MSLARFEALYAAALTADDPVAALRTMAGELEPELRDAVLGADANGVRLTALIVTRIRFERLVQGAGEAGQWFATDPRAFTADFRAYARAVPATAHDPAGEAALWRRWREARGGGVSDLAASPRGP